MFLKILWILVAHQPLYALHSPQTSIQELDNGTSNWDLMRDTKKNKLFSRRHCYSKVINYQDNFCHFPIICAILKTSFHLSQLHICSARLSSAQDNIIGITCRGGRGDKFPSNICTLYPRKFFFSYWVEKGQIKVKNIF